MSKEIAPISLSSDPIIENPKSKIQNRKGWSRRDFLKTSALAGAGAILGLPFEAPAAEPPPETTRLRLPKVPSTCTAPQYLAEQLLRSEGFTDVQYVESRPIGPYESMAVGELDIGQAFVAPLVVELDKGSPIIFLAGVHVGCFELFGTDRVRAIRDLKGKTVAVPATRSGPYFFLATMLSYVGLDPRKDVNFIERTASESIRLLTEGSIAGYLGFPPTPQELRAKRIGHVVVNSAVDKPWSQYFCCMLAANKEFARKHPVATKRAVRAILKADRICALEPERAARAIVDRGFTKNYDYALQAMKEIPYGRWRDYDPEDTIRFYSLRLHEIGMIKSSPQKLIAQGTDWRFLRELKKELKT
jgi:NitT/TauT family transport system substrate-binding protein